MFVRLLLAFTLIPLVELALLIKIGEYLGIGWTILLVAGTGIVGVSLARNQGLAVIGKLKQTLNNGQLPHDSLLDGILILVGAAMLLTPGLLTDSLGFALIIPITRTGIRKVVKKRIKAKWDFKYYDSGASFDNYNEDYSEKNDNNGEEESIIDIEDYEEIE